MLVDKARNFAIKYHEGQKYKGLPYIEHLRQVATFLILELDITNENAIAAAYLHDILEDTLCTVELLDREFNLGVAIIVSALTRYSAQTSEDYITRIHYAGRYAMAVKTADRVCNLKNLILDAEQGKLKLKLLERYERELEFIQTYFPAEFVGHIKQAHGHLRSVI